MTVAISLLRGVNVGGHNKLKMDALRELYESIQLRDSQTYVQSGNVVFRTDARDIVLLGNRIETAIEGKFGFRPTVVVRTASELRDVIARNPFADRRDLDPSKFLVTFLSRDPEPSACDEVLAIKIEPDELRMSGREVYTYYPNGIARSKLAWAVIERKLKTSGTGRNWNSILKLREIAEKLEALE